MLRFQKSFMPSLPSLSRMLSTKKPEIKLLPIGYRYFELPGKKYDQVTELLKTLNYKLITDSLWAPDFDCSYRKVDKKVDKKIELFFSYDWPTLESELTFLVSGDIDELYACDALFDKPSVDAVDPVLDDTENSKNTKLKN